MASTKHQRPQCIICNAWSVILHDSSILMGHSNAYRYQAYVGGRITSVASFWGELWSLKEYVGHVYVLVALLLFLARLVQLVFLLWAISETSCQNELVF